MSPQRSRNVPEVLFGLSLVVCMAVLGARARDPFHFSKWAFGDAQTMLSNHTWQQDGWLKSHLLFAPQGYFRGIEVLDDPPLRQHAHGTSTGGEHKIGPRRLYTHYPPGYLLPYAALRGLGFTSAFPLRIFSLFASLCGVGLFFLTLRRVSSSWLALAGSLLYLASAQFVDFADSLANHPLDDFFRFLLMWLVVSGSRWRWRWLSYLALTLVSLDSVPFAGVFCVLWTLRDGFRAALREAVTLISAPVLGALFLFVQNASYLGVTDAWRDVADVMLHQGGVTRAIESDPFRYRVSMFGVQLEHLLGRVGTMLVVLLAALLAWRAKLLRSDLAWLCGATALAGCMFVLLLPRSCMNSYQGRQFLPAVAAFALLAARSFDQLALRATWAMPRVRQAVCVLAIAAAGFRLHEDRGPYQYLSPPPRVLEVHPEVSFAVGTLAHLETRHDAVIFSASAFSLLWNPDFVPGYPQVHPWLEYFAGYKPILSFLTSDALAKDLNTLRARARQPFSPILVARSPSLLQAIIHDLQTSGAIPHDVTPTIETNNTFAWSDLTTSLGW